MFLLAEVIYLVYDYVRRIIVLEKQILKEMVIQKIKAKKENVELYSDPEDFILNCYLNRTPQSYGALIEKRIIKKNNLKKLKAKYNIGDAEENKKNKEIKVSISDNDIFNIVQIRPHADIFSYIIWFFEITNIGEVQFYCFEIPKKDIMTIDGLGGAHGTKESNKEQKNIEYRVSIKKNSNAWFKLQSYKRTMEF